MTVEAPYTDAILRSMGVRVRGMASGISSAEQTAASLLSRSFVSAAVEGGQAHLFDPETLDTMASEMTIYGQSIWLRENGGLKWVQHATVARRTGNYRIKGKTYSPGQVFHLRTNIDRLSGMGRSDLAIALDSRDFIRSLEGNLASEVADPFGYVIPTQNWKDSALQAKLGTMDGETILVPSETMNMLGSPASITAQFEWTPRRLGFNAPGSVREWHESARMTALGVMGIPASLYSPADASAMREGWRLYIFTVVEPRSKLLSAAAARCGLDVKLNLDRLMASDIANRARAYRQLVDGNMDEERAEGLTGLS